MPVAPRWSVVTTLTVAACLTAAAGAAQFISYGDRSALFRGLQDDHRPHDSTANLLHPFNVEVFSNRARQSWEAAGLRLDVSLGGGSDDQCESWFLALRRAGDPYSE